MNHSRAFIELYVPVHTNMSTYLFGICNGVFCHHIRSKNIQLSKAAKRFILWGAYVTPLVAAYVVALHYYFYAYDIPKPSLFHAFFSILTRNVWGLFASFSTAAYLLKIESKSDVWGFSRSTLFCLWFQTSSSISFKRRLCNRWVG